MGITGKDLALIQFVITKEMNRIEYFSQYHDKLESLKRRINDELEKLKIEVKI